MLSKLYFVFSVICSENTEEINSSFHCSPRGINKTESKSHQVLQLKDLWERSQGHQRVWQEQQHSFWTPSLFLNVQFTIINLKKLNRLQLLSSNYCDRLHNKTLLVFILSFSHTVPVQAQICSTAQSWASDKFRFYKADIEIMHCWHPRNTKRALWDVNPGWQVPVLCWPIWVSSMWDVLIDLYVLNSIYMGFVSANPWKARWFVCHNLGQQF